MAFDPRLTSRGLARALVLVACLIAAGPALGQTVREDFAITNGTVNAQLLSGGTLYIGGAFTRVGPVTGSGVPLNATTGVAIPGYPQVVGDVLAVVSDGAGGWFIGGTFTSVGGQARAGLAQILSDNSVSSWNPGTNGAVRSLVLDGTTLYAGGDFTSAGGQTRNRIAAIDATTGAATAWDPNANAAVRAIAVAGGVVYAGGSFTNIGGQTRVRIAALDPGTGLATAWNPNSNSIVFAIVPSGATIYVGGQFTSIGGQSRLRIAALSTVTGFATSWNPNSNNLVLALAESGGTVYAAGQFTSIGGQPRNRIAALDGGTGLATTWNPNANANVTTLALNGTDLLAGGDFATIGGQSRSRIAALDTGTGLATAWDPSAYGSVSALAVQGSVVFAGGAFSGMGGLVRNNLAAIDVGTGSATAWDPGPNNQVLALAMAGGAVVAGGSFSVAGGQSRSNLAAIDVSTGLATAWNPGVNGEVASLAAGTSTVYVGGIFSNAGGQPRNNIVELDVTTGLATAWNPGTNGQVLSIEPGSGRIFVGGIFTNVGGQTRNSLAAVDPATGAVLSWNPNPNGTVRAMRVSCGTLYVGGFFSTISGQTRNALAALNATTGAPTSWNPSANGPIFALELSGTRMYVGGVFNIVGGQNRDRVASIDPLTGLATAWNANASGTVRTVIAGGGKLYAAGAYTTVDGISLSNLAAIDDDGTCPTLVVSPAYLPTGVTGTSYSQGMSTSGGTGAYCYAVVSGSLPAGLSLNASNGIISGTPGAAGTSVFSIRATDATGCSGSASYVLTIFSTPPVSTVAANTAGLTINPAHPCVSVPVLFTRGESEQARGISVTFQIEVSKLALCGTPAASIHAGTWLASFANTSFQVVDNGGGSYTVDQAVLGSPCGQTAGGELFRIDLASSGPDGSGAITVTSVSGRDCDGAPINAGAGAPAALPIQNAPLTVLPATLPDGTTGAAYSQAFTTTEGVDPQTWAVTAGSLPPGLTLSTAGLLSGIPTTTGTFPFTVGVTDVHDCAGSRSTSVTVTCGVMAIRPPVVADGVLGVAYSQALTTTFGLSPFAWTIADGSLPDGLLLNPATGEISGTPTATGTSIFTVHVADGSGCEVSEGYVLTIFATTPGSTVAANTTGLCISPTIPCVSVPFEYVRDESTPVRGISVTFQIDTSKLVLCGTPLVSIEQGTWLAGFTNKTFQVVDNGGGSYTVDQALLGSPCGQTAGGELFRVDLKGAGVAGTGAITVTAVKSRDCDSNPVPAIAGAPASLTIQTTTPTAISDLAAVQVTSGNGAGSTTGITVTWATGGAGTVNLYRAPFGAYPEYDDAGPVSPPNPALAPGAPWVLAAAAPTSGYVDHPPVRGFWYYVALITDPCGASATSNMTAGALNYHLGDVSDGLTAGTGNNRVATEDLSLLGANYGITEPAITNRGVAYLDVGPTTDLQVTSRPTTDNLINFDDLMVFSTNFYVVSAPNLAAGRAGARPTGATPAAGAGTTGGAEEFRLVAPSLVTAGETVTATVWLKGGGRMQGFTLALGWDETVVAAEGMESGQWVEGQGGVVLSPGPGRVDAALLGLRGVGMAGEGVVARVTFRALRAGNPGIVLAQVEGRDAANRRLGEGDLGVRVEAARPGWTVLLGPKPNPMRSGEGTELEFGLAEGGAVELMIYGVDGRRVRTLVQETREAGMYRERWDGRDDGGHGSPSGVYYARLLANG
ncbi:MAG TPA: putative Ig domain-containing protein, partial [Candidatus Eisenbacteria bacterium]|nr:putative Ig domain-containing protein [Candidatus Eisenbacteria bacterium]